MRFRAGLAALICGTLGGGTLAGGDHAHDDVAKAGSPVVARLQIAPSVLRSDRTEPVTLTAFVTGGTPTAVEFVDRARVRYPMRPSAALGTYSVSLPASIANQGLSTDDVFRKHIGEVELFDGTLLAKINTFTQVWTPEIGLVNLTQRSATAQSTNTVLNIADAQAFADNASGGVAQRITAQLYAHFPDEFDFVNVVWNASIIGNRNHAAVRNTVQGIGKSQQDAGVNYGSARNLLGVTVYPSAPFFDGASLAAAHEIGHQWVNHLQNPLLRSVGAHWPLSSVASGVMGFSIAGSGAGGNYNCEPTPSSAGMVGKPTATAPKVFRDLDLYLMGLIPASAVSDIYVLKNQTLATASACPALSPLADFDKLSINDVIATNGPRVPDVSQSQKSFRVATIVVSDEKLSAEAMAFYDFFAKRFEAQSPTLVRDGLAIGIANPFSVATGNRATLNAKLSATSAGAFVTVFEFFAPSLNHYFRTANVDEANGLSANPILGWQATGANFKAYTRNEAADGAKPVCRFYGSVSPGPNSHFYTANAGECNALKSLQATTPASVPRWNYEEIAFAIHEPNAGVCPAVAPNPVYRAYNNRAAQNDSNHRYTASLATYNQMISQGWAGEGVTMCAPN
jgi:Repeat of unknown function (DUF5648)